MNEQGENRSMNANPQLTVPSKKIKRFIFSKNGNGVEELRLSKNLEGKKKKGKRRGHKRRRRARRKVSVSRTAYPQNRI